MESTIWELLRTLDDPVKLTYFRDEKVGVRDRKRFFQGYESYEYTDPWCVDTMSSACFCSNAAWDSGMNKSIFSWLKVPQTLSTIWPGVQILNHRTHFIRRLLIRSYLLILISLCKSEEWDPSYSKDWLQIRKIWILQRKTAPENHHS